VKLLPGNQRSARQQHCAAVGTLEFPEARRKSFNCREEVYQVMKKAAFLLALGFLLASATVPLFAGPCGGFSVTITHTAPGEGTFVIGGENDYGSVDVSGTFAMTTDKETKIWELKVVFDEGSTITCADGTVIDLSGQELTFNGEGGHRRVGFLIVQYLKSLLEGA